MDKLEQSQIRLLLEHLTAQRLASCKKSQKQMHAEHSAKKIIRSGHTIKRAVEICEAEGRAFIAAAVKQVGDVAKSPEAFDKIVSSLTAQTRNWDAHVAEAVRLATMGGPQVTARLLPRLMVLDSLDDVGLVDDGMKQSVPVFG